MAELRAYPSALVAWNNVWSLHNLAIKYDMPVVGAACADFLSRNKASLTLDAPLASPKNVLMAASLCSRYSSGCATPVGCPAAAAGERSPPERLAAAASVTPTHGSAATRPAVEAGRVELTFPSGETLSAQTFALQNASRVLKEALSKPLATPGVLTLGNDDCLAAWSAVVQMAEMSAYPPELVNWDTLAGLLRLADKYDMPMVGAACADFIARNATRQH
ncbi:hypothetical protein GPECTOR_151g46 [Gonium pectorale]|uniref:BTB domain-containing protein n=1 Tax=Gonium pectorale TaxID=33097 RepID=A0A150FYW9_GONPE|nr:hypothetical protein GPECTOR_151g46 [Gonium pectorale]|eukprot:KXZ42405.1 hypothetical protein GPECTOR_151g46 [Gonium pectorale]